MRSLGSVPKRIVNVACLESAMCGIAGAILYGSARPDIFFHAVAQCRSRGEDSFGVVRWSPEGGWKELRRFQYSIDECVTFFDDGTPRPHYYVHTSRAEPTTEFQVTKTAADVPPFRNGDIAVAHNGIVANDAELASRFRLDRPSSIDTAIIPSLVERVGVWNTIRELQGGNALAVLDARRRSLYLARNFLPLAVVWQPGILAFASESRFFPNFRDPFPSFRTWEMPAFTSIEFSHAGYRRPIPWGDLPDGEYDRSWHRFPDC